MKRSIAFLLLPALASLALAAASAAQSYPPDQGYPDQEPYYQPPPDGSYEDQTYDDQDYPDQTAYDNQSDNQGPVDESVFYGELSPYGRWFQRAGYGWVWEPTRVAVGWRPYTQGHWVDTDYGWTWVSDEPWGWATYHYGRWTLDPDYGWLWVPGTEWGPAWVSFQEGNGYIGWAPLPPSVGFRAGFGIQIGGLSLSAEINPLAYSFVSERAFLSERIAVEIAPPARNVTFIRGSRNITNIRVENDRVVNRSFSEERIQQATGRPVHRYRLNEVRNPAQGRVSRVQGDQVTIFRPAPTLVQARPDNTPPAVIQRRQRLAQQRQGGQGGQAQPQAPQPQQVQPQPGRAPQTSQPTRLSGADLDRKHQVEQQQLQARQNAERSRLQQEHQQQQANQQTRGRAPDLPAQQQAEQRALQEQQKREQQLLEARHQRERQTTQANQNRPPGQQGRPAQPQNQNQPQRETQQRRNREQERAREEQQQRDKQPPPPPPQR